MNKQQLALIIGAAVLLLAGFAVAVSVYNSQRAEELEEIAEQSADKADAAAPVNNAFVRTYSQRMGPPDAKVTIVEFLDPGCETCAAMSPHIKKVVEAHPGKVQLVLRYIPLHKGADQAVLMLEAARKQNKYWETLQLMFDTQPQWADHHRPNPDLLWEYLPSLGLDMNRLREDMYGMDVAHILKQDMEDARTLGVRRTPGIFVNNMALVPFGVEELKKLVASQVKDKYGE